MSYADEVEDVLAAAELLAKEGISCDVYKLVRIFPFEEELIRDLSALSRRSDGRRVRGLRRVGEHARPRPAGCWLAGPVHPPCREEAVPASRDGSSNQTGDWAGCRTSGEAVREADPKGEKTL